MAFDKSNFGAVGGIGGANPVIYSYTTTDAIADVNTAGYFNDLAATLNVGDSIFCFTSTGGTPANSIVWVNSNDGTTVDVTDGLTITATDTD